MNVCLYIFSGDLDIDLDLMITHVNSCINSGVV